MYRVYFVSICETINHVVTAPHCIIQGRITFRWWWYDMLFFGSSLHGYKIPTCFYWLYHTMLCITAQIAKFVRSAWGPPGADRTHWAPCWPHGPCYQGMSSLLGDTISIINKMYMFYFMGEAKDDHEPMISEALAPSTTILQCGINNLKWPRQNFFT